MTSSSILLLHHILYIMFKDGDKLFYRRKKSSQFPALIMQRCTMLKTAPGERCLTTMQGPPDHVGRAFDTCKNRVPEPPSCKVACLIHLGPCVAWPPASKISSLSCIPRNAPHLHFSRARLSSSSCGRIWGQREGSGGLTQEEGNFRAPLPSKSASFITPSSSPTMFFSCCFHFCTADS
jgi:hypothetical protein